MPVGAIHEAGAVSIVLVVHQGGHTAKLLASGGGHQEEHFVPSGAVHLKAHSPHCGLLGRGAGRQLQAEEAGCWPCMAGERREARKGAQLLLRLSQKLTQWAAPLVLMKLRGRAAGGSNGGSVSQVALEGVGTADWADRSLTVG